MQKKVWVSLIVLAAVSLLAVPALGQADAEASTVNRLTGDFQPYDYGLPD